MKRKNFTLVVARLMLIVLTLAITVFSFASCDSLPPELQGLLGGNPNASCEHEYDNACDFRCNKCGASLVGFPTHEYDNACDTECNECGATRTIKHTYVNGVCSVCGAADESVPTCEHTNVENCVCKDCGATAHTAMEWHAAFPPTCIINGSNTDLYFCSDCGKAFMDEDGTIEAIHEDVVIFAQGHNYVNGICDKCGESSCKHPNIENCVCKDCGATAHKNFLSNKPTFVPAVEPTCEQGGNIEYYGCVGCLGFFSDAEGKNKLNPSDVIISPLGHNYVDGACDRCGAVECKHTTVENCVCKDCGASVHTDTECIPSMAPTCGDTGFRCDVYLCNDCEKAFYDAEAKNEITDVASVIIPPLGHIIVGSVCERCGSLRGDSGDNNGNHPGEPTPFELACRELASLYGPDNKKATSSDYELVSKIVIEGEVFAVTWTIANESITVTYDADKDVYIVDVPDEVSKNCYYSLEAAILNNSNGRTIKYQFIRLLEATENTDGDGDSSVCQHKNAEYVKATPDIACNYFGVLFDIYVCCDCLDIFYDAKCENKVPYDTAVTIPPRGHKYVGDICEKCGFYMHEGLLPSRPSEPTPLESAWFYLIDLYYDDNKTPTPSDYELVSKVVIEGEEFAVTWTVANESITVTYDEDKDVYVVNVPDVVNEKCYYSIKATISDGEGNTLSWMFARVLEVTSN
ncbi:MAG: hypothetical protein IJD79_08330 [Clostridia bacterium]|nr:hypothetical protein [Clostridia bacterium]